MRALCLACVMVVGCDSTGGRVGPSPPSFFDLSTSSSGDMAMPDEMMAAVYAHSDTDLYRIDPDTLAITHVGPFGWPRGADQMTDIAIDRDGKMVGVSYDKVYTVDKMTAQCTYLAPLDRSFNGLSFVPAAAADPSRQEMLVGAALDGSFYELNPTTGASRAIGNYGGGLTSSGDIVSVQNFGTVATVKNGTATVDFLASVDTLSGKATIIGSTGVSDIWGLGFWKNKVFGFTSGGSFVLLDPKTGLASVVQTGGVSWWGAGVTTIAPVIQ
jgi:hypothetical protein